MAKKGSAPLQMVPCDGPLLIAFGANIDPHIHLQQGLQQLHERLGIVAISTVYRSEPLGGAPGDPPFLNGALQLKQAPKPWDLRYLLRQVEAAQGRVRGKNPNAPRTLDLDIALMGDQVIQAPPLRIPDPDLPQRAFLALPLAQLAPDWVHPQLGQTLAHIATTFNPLPLDMTVDADATRRLAQILT
ncbi:2-amino-4-hydroxy-6-hydroxymethyldihydropteridine diphosphokinase [Magnetococcus sp. PR-3]|uniref:2-amino-4-hydroxy-6- hydroxymethyldihydropteridine diphosphokinase n=1 Tax=Magnetococcus sp. PR-3 TaxID=3120355 RepID=UPI002FCDF0DE